MIKPEQIPDVSVDEAIYAFYTGTGPKSRDDWRNAITAAINAWPGKIDFMWFDQDYLGFPLPQEKKDD